MANYLITVNASGFTAVTEVVEADSLEEAETFEAQVVQNWLGLNDQINRQGNHELITGLEEVFDVKKSLTVTTVLQ